MRKFLLVLMAVVFCFLTLAWSNQISDIMGQIISSYRDDSLEAIQQNKKLSQNLVKIIISSVVDKQDISLLHEFLNFCETIPSEKGKRAFYQAVKMLATNLVLNKEMLEGIKGGRGALKKMEELFSNFKKIKPDLSKKILSNKFFNKEKIFSTNLDEKATEGFSIKFEDRKENDSSWEIKGFDKDEFIEKFKDNFRVKADVLATFIRDAEGKVYLEALLKNIEGEDKYRAKYGFYQTKSYPEDEFSLDQILTYNSMIYYEVAIDEETLNLYPPVASIYLLKFFPSTASLELPALDLSKEGKDLLIKNLISFRNTKSKTILQNNSSEDYLFVLAKDPLEIISFLGIGKLKVTSKGNIRFQPVVLLRNGEPVSELERGVIDSILKTSFQNARSSMKSKYKINLQLKKVYLKEHAGKKYLVFVGGKKYY